MFLGISGKLWVALAVTLLACMGISLPYPVLTPLFIDAPATALNSYLSFDSETLLITLFAIYPLGIFIGSSFIGALSDRYGRRKVLAQTLMICFVGYWVSAYALYTEDYLLLLISRFLTGISEGNVAIARAIALDIGARKGQQATTTQQATADRRDNDVPTSASSDQKTRAVSLINSAVFVGWLLGPLIGGALAEYGAHTAMFAAAFASFVCVVLVKLVLEETNQTQPDVPMSLWRSVIQENSLRLVAEPWMRQLFIVYFFYALAMNLFYEFYPVWLVDTQGFSSLDLGLATTCMTIFMTLSSIFVVTKLQRRMGLLKPMVNALLSLAVLLVLVPFTSGIYTLLLFAVTGVLVAIFNGVLPVFISENQSDKKNGAAMGLLTTTFCIANVVAAIFGGVILQLSSKWPLFLSAMFYLVSVSLLYKSFVLPLRQKETPSLN